MSHERLVVSELLAFLQQQLDVMDEVSVVQICKSNYKVEEICSAKTLLYESLDMRDRMPSRRRDERGERSLQDMITLLKEVDPDDVPTFVVKDLRKLPPVTFDHVDVSSLLKDIMFLKTSLAEVQRKLDATENIVSDLHTELSELRGTACRSVAEVSNVNVRRRGAGIDVSQLSFESAKLDSPLADNSAGASACRAATPAPPVSEKPKSVNTSTPRRDYATATRSPPQTSRRKNEEREQPTTAVPPCSTRNIDDEGFTKVEKKKRKPTSRNLRGAARTGGQLLRAAVPTTLLYVSRLFWSTTSKEIVDYIQTMTNLILRVELLESRNKPNFKSFVVRVPTSHLQTFMDEEFWPKGVLFRRFRGRLRDSTAQLN